VAMERAESAVRNLTVRVVFDLRRKPTGPSGVVRVVRWLRRGVLEGISNSCIRSGMAGRSSGAETVPLPVNCGVVRLARDGDLPDPRMAHMYIPPLKVPPGGTDARPPPGNTRDDSLSKIPPRSAVVVPCAATPCRSDRPGCRPKLPATGAPRAFTTACAYFFSMPPLSISSFVVASFFSSQDT